MSLLSLVLGLVMYGQENNPYNTKGEEFISSLNLIAEDYFNGTVKDFTDESIRIYSSRLPIRHEISMDIVSQVFRTIKSPGFDVFKFIAGTPFSQELKNVFKKVIVLSSSVPMAELKMSLRLLVEEIQRSSISEKERELGLILVSIAHNSDLISHRMKDRPDVQCYLSGPGGSGVEQGVPCIIAGIATGAIVGWQLCGFWCMLGGAVVGGLIGGLS